MISNGSGWQPMPTQKKLSDVISEAGTEKVPEDFGNHFRLFIAGAPYVIRISGQRMRKYYLRSGIVLFRSRAEKQVISGDSIIRSDREFPVR